MTTVRIGGGASWSAAETGTTKTPTAVQARPRASQRATRRSDDLVDIACAPASIQNGPAVHVPALASITPRANRSTEAVPWNHRDLTGFGPRGRPRDLANCR